MQSFVVLTGASSGFGALTARELARAGHSFYAGMRETARFDCRLTFTSRLEI